MQKPNPLAVHKLLTIVVTALTFSSFLPSPASAATTGPEPGQVDPSSSLPRVSEWLPDFSHLPQFDSALVTAGTVGSFHWYGRTDSQSGEEDALLVAGITVSELPASARAVFRETTRMLRGRGYELERVDGLVGESTLIGRRALGAADEPGEALVVYFRGGPVGGVIEWEDYSGRPDLDTALSLARSIQGRAA
jgi:hypothetical protein